MNIEIGSYQKRMRPQTARLKAVLRKALRGRRGEVSVAIVSRQRIRGVNKKHLGRDRETDVIAFDLSDEHDRKAGRIVGEIVVSADRAVSEGARRGHSAEAELGLYVVHGALHLMGMNDDDANGRAAMHGAAMRVLRGSGYVLCPAAGPSQED